MIKRLMILVALSVTFILASCAPSMIPATVPGGIVDLGTRSLSLTNEGITITVYADAWRYDPFEVQSRFTPVLIAVQNNTGSDILIDENSIFMYDDNNTQYGVVTAENVDRAFSSGYYFPPMYVYGEAGHWWNGWGLGFYGAYPYGGYAYGRNQSDVIPMAYRFGPVMAGARAHGFVYLQKLPSAAGGARVVVAPSLVTGKTISFTFPFVIER
jgi:hypothetical protein